jgi:acyl dehydratase
MSYGEPQRPLFFEEFKVGDRYTSPGYTFTEAAIIDFAFQYDPQLFHLDVEAAKQTIYGGLIASGFQTLCIAFRLVNQSGLPRFNVGGKGIDEVRWIKAVRPGDTLHVEVEVADVQPSRMVDRGNVQLKYTALNQKGEPVLTALLNHMIRTRVGAA